MKIYKRMIAAVLLMLLSGSILAVTVKKYYFYTVAVLLAVCFGLYFLWVYREICREKAVNEKQLRSVQYILDVEKKLFDAHLHPGHFTTAMQKVADYLDADVAFFWLAEGNPTVQRRLWSNCDNLAIEQNSEPLAPLPNLFAFLREEGELISYDMESLCKKYPSGRENISRYHIDSLMLIPSAGVDEKVSIILGACNMKQHWKNAEALEQVSLSISMAVNHYEAYLAVARMGYVDSLTGMLNRNSYHTAIDRLSEEEHHSLACVYIDANGLHEINNHLGHQAGDEMLIAVANALKDSFPQGRIYRIGGDEFVVLCQDLPEQEVYHQAELAGQIVRRQDYDISIGISWQEQDYEIKELVNEAEEKMQNDKRRFYQNNGQKRNMRTMNKHLEQMILEKQDADAFLSVLAPEFKGVYFVDLNTDTVRHLYIPYYFEIYLKKSGNVFSKAIRLYASQVVKPAYVPLFTQLCDYEQLEKQLDDGIMPKFLYQKTNGEWLKLRVLKFKDYSAEHRETLWIFSTADKS